MADCAFCGEQKSTIYTCPRCNILYCSVRCYQHQKHSQCSEQFYENCVQEELKSSSACGSTLQAKHQTIDALKRLKEGDDKFLETQDEILDSDDEEDINSRLHGVNLNDPKEIWDKLVDGEKLEFQKLVETGEIEKYVPKFVPWWNKDFNVSEVLIKDIESDTNMLKTEAYMKNMKEIIPQVMFEKISDLSKLLGNQRPSPNIKFNVLNVVYSYAYALKYFRGDYSECPERFVEMCYLLSGNLRESHNFDSSDLAIESAASNVNLHSMISVSPEFTKEVKNDVLKIIRGPREKIVNDHPLCKQNIFLLAAIADLNHVIKLCISNDKRSKSQETKYEKNKNIIANCKFPDWINDNGLLSDNRNIKLDIILLKNSTKKLKFFQSWIVSCYDEFKNFS